MSELARQRLFDALDELVLIDPHTHVNPHAPASETLADILGYHYYTELAHSAGMPRERIEEPGLDPREKVGRLAEYLDRIDNTVQLSRLCGMGRALFDVERDRIDRESREEIYDAAARTFASKGWEDEVLRRSRVEKVFLTNDFDDPLEGFDTNRYVPCLRTDDLVFKLHLPEVRQRLAKATGIEVGDAKSLRAAVRKLFEHFTAKEARACAISLPPWFGPRSASDDASREAVTRDFSFALKTDSGEAVMAFPQRFRTLNDFVFWTLAEHCREFN